jgi:beta-mannosidase
METCRVSPCGKHNTTGKKAQPDRFIFTDCSIRGWDWGPVLCPCGPWRPVRLQVYKARIADLRIDYELSPDLKSVKGVISATVEGASTGAVTFVIQRATNKIFTRTIDVPPGGVAKANFTLDNVQLWYPHGYGGQPMYDIIATVSPDEKYVDTNYRRIGFRKAELVQMPVFNGKTFFFRVNNVDIFCGGSDWIPADSFTPRISAERYRKWLQMMVDGFQVMIR